MHAITYTRVSTSEQAEGGTSLDTQRQRCREYVEREGWTLVDEFEDAGVSGKKESRPGLDRLMRAARAGEFEALVVAKLDRLGRSTRHLLEVIDELDALSVRVVFLDPSVDTSTAMGRFFITTLAAIAELEHSMIRERTYGGRLHRVREGKWVGGPAKFGYFVDDFQRLQINHAEAEPIRFAVGLVLDDGLTISQTCQRLNALGHKTRGSVSQPPRSWSTTLLRNVLTSPSIVGRHAWGADHVYEAEPIIDPSRFDQLQAVLDRSARKGYKEGRPGGYPLSGFLLAECGAEMTGQWSAKEQKAYYKCSNRKHGGGCKCRQVSAEHVEMLARTKIGLDLLSRENLDRLLADFLAENPDDGADELAQVEIRVGDIDKRLQRILVLDDLDGDALQGAVSELTEQKRDLLARRDVILATAARAEARDELADRLHEVADAALEGLSTPEGLRSAMNAFDISVAFSTAETGRRLRITGRADLSSAVLPQAASSGR